ncbi:MAG: rod shape-determining protein MreC [Candidatus Pacebacteria bacterium]|nr:rod shape-determining protein MreC [Candidatus Paceibacterota bacterium]
MITHRDKKNKTKRNVTVFTVGVFLIYGLFFSPAALFFSGVAHTVMTPVWKIGYSIENSMSPFLSYFSSRRSLWIENKDLQVQIDSMVAKVAERNFLRIENRQLKEMLGRDDKESRIFAVVLANADQTLYDTIIVDVGVKQGVSKGDMVLLEDVAIGEVFETFYTSSKVKLYSSSGNIVEVIIGEEAIRVDALGYGAGNFEIKLPRNSGVSIGDTVYLPNIFPRVLGMIEEIDDNPNDAFERVLFKSPINPFTLRFVEIVP